MPSSRIFGHTPLTMLPGALADIAVMLKIEGLLAGTVAGLLDPASLDDPDQFHSDVITIVFPGLVSQALRTAGVRAGEQLTRAVIRKYATEQAMSGLARVAGKHFGARITREALITKTVPLVGSGIGAGWNWIEIRAVGSRAIDYFRPDPLALGHRP